MPEFEDYYEQIKSVDREQLIASCKECLIKNKWQILDIEIEEVDLLKKRFGDNIWLITINFSAKSSFSMKWTNQGIVEILYGELGYRVKIDSSCSIFARGDFFERNMFELFRDLKLATFSLKESKPKENKKSKGKTDKKEAKIKTFSIAEELEALLEMLNKGILTKSEFNKAKKKLLD